MIDLDEIEKWAKTLNTITDKRRRGEDVAIGEINNARQNYDDVSQPQAILELIAEVRRLLTDAERYRWLRGQNISHASDWCVENNWLWVENLDAEIDAARGIK